MRIVINSHLSANGYNVTFNNNTYSVNYPHKVWRAFPRELRKSFSQMMAFILTVHKSFSLKNTLHYLFPPPIGESLFYYGLFLAMPENVLDFDKKYKTSDYLRFILNSHYHISFTGHAVSQIQATYTPNQQVALLPFTFGKDSLLTYALCNKLKIKPVPLFMLEPSNQIENKIKLDLANQFKKEFDTDIQTFQVPMAEMKETSGLWWGWDIFLTQYTLHLLPFMYYHKAGYLFWSNEFECNEFIKDNEGYYLNDQFEQSGRWMQSLNSALRLFGCNAKLGSLLEPLTELSILAILHKVFPDLGKYQASCMNDTVSKKSGRWCGKCYECARVAISLQALGIDPHLVDLNDNMLTKSKRDLFYVFSESEDELHSKFPFLKNEKLFAFYLAYKRGIRGDLMNEFKMKYLDQVIKNIKQNRKQFFSAYPSIALPEELHSWLYKFYDRELIRVRSEIQL